MKYAILMAVIFITACTGVQAAPDISRDTCGATPLQGFVGKPRTSLPVNLPKGARVLCNTCAATMDYSEQRLNIIYDTNTGIIEKVRCG